MNNKNKKIKYIKKIEKEQKGKVENNFRMLVLLGHEEESKKGNTFIWVIGTIIYYNIFLINLYNLCVLKVKLKSYVINLIFEI